MGEGRALRRFAASLVLLAALLGFGELCRVLASYSRAPLALDVGPGTGHYLRGFTESEERRPISFRWTRERARVWLPLDSARGKATLEIRLARFLDGNAEVRLFATGEPIGVFSARSGRFRTLELPLALPEGPFLLELLVADPDPSALGIAIDWIRLRGARWKLPLEIASPRLLLAGIFLLMLVTGFSLPWAVAGGALLALTQAFWFARDPFAMVHAHESIVMHALVSTALVAVAFRGTAGRRLVPLLYLAGFLLKGSALFHPSYFYPDVRHHRRYLHAFESAEGTLAQRGVAAQKASNIGYPRRIAGRPYALPYSPVFYLPLTVFDRDARGTEAVMKQAGLLLAALELPLVFLLAQSLVGARAAAWAALLTASSAPITSRLLFAQWPTLAGHLLDLLALLLAVRVLGRPREWRSLGQYALAGFASSLTYISSLFNLSFFTGFVAIWEPRCRGRLLGTWLVVGLAVVVLLYTPFLGTFFFEILPSLGEASAAAASEPAGPISRIGPTLGRIPMFFGYGLPALAIAGLVLIRREDRGPAYRLLVAYGSTFLALSTLRVASDVFKDLKELVFIAPWFSILAGVSLGRLATRDRWGEIAAGAIAAGLLAFQASKHFDFQALHTVLAGLP